MAYFTLTFDNRDFEFKPFVVAWDVFLGMTDPDYYPTVTPPNHFECFNDIVDTEGTTMNLFDIFKPVWQRLRSAGVDYYSQNERVIAVEIDGVVSEVYNHYSFDHTKPNELKVYLEFPTGQQTQEFTFNYMRGQTDYDATTSTIYCIENKIFDCPNDTYEGCSWFALCAIYPWYVYQSADIDTIALPPTYIPQTISSMELTGKPINELLPADVRLRALDPMQLYQYSYTNSFGYKGDIYPQPYGAGFFNALTFNTATANEILVNDRDINEYIDDTTPDTDYTNSNTWSQNVSNWHEPSDYIGFPDEIINDSLSYGFIHAYYLAPANAMALNNYLLSDNFIDNVKKLMANPIDYIMGLTLLPIVPSHLTNSTIIIGGVDTEIQAQLLTKQFQFVDFGKIHINEKWGGFPDYTPCTKAHLFAPCIGDVELNVDDIMDADLHLKYRVDLLTGECVAMLIVDNSKDLNGVTYHFRGSIGHSSPITNNDYSQKISSVLNGAGSIVGAVASGAGGNVAGAVTGGIAGGTSLLEGFASKPTIQRTGGVGGTAGVMDILRPYVMIERPVQALPTTYQQLNGYSSCQGGKVRDFHGFLQVGEIDLSGLSCTEEEKNEILADLKGGVFV